MNIFKNAHYLLLKMTEPEKLLEVEIARLGERYRSQFLILGTGIVDFALLDRQVIIEVDGHSHEGLEQRCKDLRRDIKLEMAGWKVLRCKNAQVTANPGYALVKLLVAIEERPSLPEMRAALLALDPLDVLGKPKRTKRKPSTRPRAVPSPRARKVAKIPKA